MKEVLQPVGPSCEVKLLFNGTALMFLFSQASSRGDGNNSDVNSSSSDMLDIILHEDSCSGTGSATSGSMGSGSNGCGTSASGTSNSGTSKSRTSASGASASGTSGSGTGLFQHLVDMMRSTSQMNTSSSIESRKHQSEQNQLCFNLNMVASVLADVYTHRFNNTQPITQDGSICAQNVFNLPEIYPELHMICYRGILSHDFYPLMLLFLLFQAYNTVFFGCSQEATTVVITLAAWTRPRTARRSTVT